MPQNPRHLPALQAYVSFFLDKQHSYPPCRQPAYIFVIAWGASPANRGGAPPSTPPKVLDNYKKKCSNKKMTKAPPNEYGKGQLLEEYPLQLGVGLYWKSVFSPGLRYYVISFTSFERSKERNATLKKEEARVNPKISLYSYHSCGAQAPPCLICSNPSEVKWALAFTNSATLLDKNPDSPTFLAPTKGYLSKNGIILFVISATFVCVR
jgi:hypothetical protein